MIATLAQARRNLTRNRRRTAITVAAVALSTAMVTLAGAMIDGMLVGAVRNATNLTVGELQIHAPDYVERRSFYDHLTDHDEILAAAHERGIPAVRRSFGYGLLANETKSAGALLWGIEPAAEAAAFDLALHIDADRGAFLDLRPRRGLVLGRKLARSLGVGVGEELVVVVQAADGSLGNELFSVTGILKAVGDAVDRSAALMHRTDFEELFVSNGRVHEIALNTRGQRDLDELVEFATAAAADADVRSWRTLMPALSDMLAMADGAMWILGAVFFTAAGLGVMNTMLMATYERIREFGVLKALGASPIRIVLDVVTEALLLAFAGTLVGAAVGLAASQLLARHGINTARYAGETSFAGVAFDPIWRAAPNYGDAAQAIVLMCVIAVATSLYPALLAARLKPVDAMRRT
jgi:ABC-type lipoprotein release transport system permease subunit